MRRLEKEDVIIDHHHRYGHYHNHHVLTITIVVVVVIAAVAIPFVALSILTLPLLPPHDAVFLHPRLSRPLLAVSSEPLPSAGHARANHHIAIRIAVPSTFGSDAAAQRKPSHPPTNTVAVVGVAWHAGPPCRAHPHSNDDGHYEPLSFLLRGGYHDLPSPADGQVRGPIFGGDRGRGGAEEGVHAGNEHARQGGFEPSNNILRRPGKRCDCRAS
mmetsp:Transcript_27880/g.52046  ORF Transcript_27880/g.52046 Transcript_27880/m.52046 type:complete len:215 (-) Transcript_27880:470-1114(-)